MGRGWTGPRSGSGLGFVCIILVWATIIIKGPFGIKVYTRTKSANLPKYRDLMCKLFNLVEGTIIAILENPKDQRCNFPY